MRLLVVCATLFEMSTKTTVLMCRPDYFDIQYEINPWMKTSNPVEPQLATKQWQGLYNLYSQRLGWQVELIEPVAGLPDMVFTANGGLVIDKQVALPNFRHVDRQPETELFSSWFKSHGYVNHFSPRYNFEGEGDALVWGDYILAGYPWRSSQLSHLELAKRFKREVISLQLADARFYHLDTCLTPVDEDTIAVYPAAFTAEALTKIKTLAKRVIEASQADAAVYGLNAIADDRNIIISDKASGLIDSYQQLGFKCWPVAVSEFQKSGGGIKCLTLKLSQ